MRHDEATTEATDSDETPAPLRRRKAHIRESNEAHLLACAEAVFAERGLDGASTAMIAKWIVVSVVMPSGSRLSPEADVAEVSFICL